MRCIASLLLLLLLTGCNSAKPPANAPPAPSTNLRFREVTAETGIAMTRSNGAFGKRWMPETMGGGGAFLDYDNDGWQDILLINNPSWPGRAPASGSSPSVLLYRNTGKGTFEDVTGASGLKLPDFYGMGVAVGDYDNDGCDDLFLTAVGRSRLFRNVPDGKGGRRFTETTAASGINDTGFSTSAAWLDYDNDGRLDLFVCHYLKWSPETDLFCGSTVKAYCRPQEYPGETCRLYRNEGGGKFRDVTQRAGLLNPNSKALGVCIEDMDDDGDPDIFVANDMEPNSVYRNEGDGTFTEIGLQTGISLDNNGRARAGMGIDSAALFPEKRALVIGNFCFEGLAFYERAASETYQERSRQAGLYVPSYPYITFGLFFADFDNDRYDDLFITNGHIEDTITQTNPGQTYAQPALLFQQQENGLFAEVGGAAGTGITEPMVGRGACRGDYDNDGKPDILLIPNVGKPRLLHNETESGHHWLGVRLVGTKSNRNAYGAKVTLVADGKPRAAFLRSGSSYLSARDNRLLFGLGKTATVERLTIQWPSGKEQTLSSPETDRYHTIKEP